MLGHRLLVVRFLRVRQVLWISFGVRRGRFGAGRGNCDDSPKQESATEWPEASSDELYPAPRSWAERAFPKLIHFVALVELADRVISEKEI